MIIIKNVTKVYPSKRQKSVVALKDISFEVEDEKFVVIVGPSGCGKSTLLKCTAGLIPVTEGAILINDVPVRGPVKGTGMVFQTPALLPWRPVMGNVLLLIELAGLKVDDYRQRADELIELTGLTDFKKSLPHELSGGMQQRVSLCRALLPDPELCLMDEPYGALDALTREEMDKELLKVWEATKKTVVFVTHDIHEAVFLADKIVIMTCRPGTVRKEIDINIPRPRKMDSPPIASKVQEIRNILFGIED